MRGACSSLDRLGSKQSAISFQLSAKAGTKFGLVLKTLFCRLESHHFRIRRSFAGTFLLRREKDVVAAGA